MFEVAGVVARLGFKVDDDGANRFERKIRGLREDTRRPVVAPLTAEIQGNELDLYSRKLEELQAKTRRRDAFRAQLGADFEPKAFTAYERELRRVEKSTRDVQRSSGDANASVAQLGVTMRKMFDSTAKIGSVGLAAQGLSAVGAGGAAAVAGLAPVAGALAAYPALASAAGQGLGVVKLATAGVTQAVGGLNEQLDRNSKAFKRLTPEGQKFAIQLDKMKAPLRELSTTAQRGLAPGLEAGLRSAIRNVDVLERGVGRTSKVLGGLAGDAGRLLGTRGFGKDLETQMRRNDVTIRRAGEGGLNLANALRHVVIEAGPLVNWMTRLGLQFTEVIEKQAKAGRESGALGRFFEQTRIQASRLIRIGTDLGAALINIGKAAYPLGTDLLGSLTKTVAKFREWTDSARGQNAIKKYFDDARPAIYEGAKLIRDLGGAFLRLGRGDQVAPLLRTVRTQLVPAVETLFQSTTKQFMPAFLRFATEAIKLFTHLAGTSGPLVSLTKLLGTLAAGLNKLLDRFPALNTAVVSLVALGGIAKALKLASAITGVGTLIGLLQKARTTAAGVAIAEGAAARGGVGVAATGAAGAGAGVAGGGLIAAAKAHPIAAAALTVTSLVIAAHQLKLEGSSQGGSGAKLPTSGGGRALAKALGLEGIRDFFRSSDLFSEGRGQLERFGDTAEKTFGRLRKASNESGLRSLAAQARELSKRFPDAARELSKFANSADSSANQIRKTLKFDPMIRDLRSNWKLIHREGSEEVQGLTQEITRNTRLIKTRFGADTDEGRKLATQNIGLIKRRSAILMHDISSNVGEQTRAIRDRLGKDTDEGRQAVAKNFRLAAKAIRDRMHEGEIDTKTGGDRIKTYLVRALKSMGLSGEQARAKVETGTIQTRRGPQADAARGGYIRRATGGWIGGRGLVSGDVVPIAPGVMAALGEYDAVGPGDRRAVLNRHQAPFAEMALAAGGYPGLDQLPAGRQLPILERALSAFGGLDRLFSTVNRPHYLAQGGIVPVPGFPGERAASGVIPMIEMIARRFGLVLTDAFGPGHQSPGHTRFGTAADFAGPDRSMDRAVRYLVGRGFLVGYDGRFGSQAWPGHGPRSVAGANAHLHVELAGHGAGAAALTAPRIPGLRTTMPGGPGALVQRAFDVARSGAQTVANRAFGSLLTTPVAGGGTGGWSKQALMGLWRRANGGLGNANLMAAIALAESGGRAGAANGPYHGLWQVGPGGSFNPLTNARQAGQKLRSQGLGAWEAYTNGNFRQFLRSGGRVGPGRAPNMEQGSGNVQGFSLRSTSRRARHRVASYDETQHRVETLRKEYALLERRYNETDEGDYLVEHEDGSVTIDQKALGRKLQPLAGMVFLARQISDALKRARRIAQSVVKSYTTIVGGLGRSLKYAKRKDRSGIQAQLKDARDSLAEWGGTVEDLRFDVDNAGIDLHDIGAEYRELVNTSGKAAPADTTTDTTGDTGPTADQTAVADQERQRADVATRRADIAEAALSAFTSSGDLGAGGANAYAAVTGQPGGPPASGYTAGPGGWGGAPAGGITIYQDINTLVPGTAEQYLAVGNAAVTGIGFQAMQSSPRISVGP